jgi:hypothetical protein
MNLLKRLRFALGFKSPAQKMYTASGMPEPIEGLANYPPKEFCGQEEIYAYRVCLMVEDSSRLVACMSDSFPTVSADVFQQGSHRASNGESLDFAIYPEFKGAALRMLTNSAQLLRAMDALQLQPPPPWKVFPHLAPDFKGAMQGEVDYWWSFYWWPFWSTASLSEREQYMQLHQPGGAWIGYLEFRDLLASAEFLEFLDKRNK